MDQHGDCQTCHGWGYAGYSTTWGGAAPSHGNGSISMNGPQPSTGAGYDNATGGCAAACHSVLFVLKTNSGWNVNYGDYGSGACETCHNGVQSAYPLAPNVMGDGTDADGGIVGTPKPYDDGSWGFNVSGHGANGTAASTTFDTNNTRGKHPQPELGLRRLPRAPEPPQRRRPGRRQRQHPLCQHVPPSDRHGQSVRQRCGPRHVPAAADLRQCLLRPVPFGRQPGGVELPPRLQRHGQRRDVQRRHADVRVRRRGSRPATTWPGRSTATSRRARGTFSGNSYATCSTCHNVHGTDITEAGYTSNRMLREQWNSANTLCVACHY